MPKRHTTIKSVLVAATSALVSLGTLVAPAHAATSTTLSNGCTASARGIPSCGAYVGGSYSSSSLSTWESWTGRHLGVHRTFWGSGSVSSAVKTATSDVAAHRVPWMSFSAPYSWSDMAAGKGDTWAKSLAAKVKAINGPVWVAIAHEPEGDGDISKWKAMQAHLAPIMRAAAPNLGYTIILMGYHELYGDSKYRLANIWPNTKIDVAGFDVYEKYGVDKVGSPMITTWKDITNKYFAPLSKWAASKGVAWGLAETGLTDAAQSKKPSWMSTTYSALKTYHGIAFSYFNTNANSQAKWALSTSSKKSSFTAINKTSAVMK
jgi:hypothetical protein